jgi:hypothetical protein
MVATCQTAMKPVNKSSERSAARSAMAANVGLA